jgi:DNA polymerase III epsilon subunit-like protein
MRHGKRWVIIDTETTGLWDPIYIVEIAGQLMEGWEPIGPGFRMLLNHDVHVPSDAVAIHGYTQEYLKAHGAPPHQVYHAFRNYARDYPVVAHNLSYDWDRCLHPEWDRLRVPPIGLRGFCTMLLGRRVVPETRCHSLDHLRDYYKLNPGGRSHRAEHDVHTVVEMFCRIYRPRLERAGLNTFDSVADFSRRTPVAQCIDIIRRPGNSHPHTTHL